MCGVRWYQEAHSWSPWKLRHVVSACPVPQSSNRIRHPTKTDGLPLLSSSGIYHHHWGCPDFVGIGTFLSRNQELPLEKNKICWGQGAQEFMAYRCGGLNLRVRMKRRGWMNMVNSGIGKFWWKGFPGVPAMERGWGATNVAWEDAVSKDLSILQDYIFGVLGCRTWGVSANGRIVYDRHNVGFLPTRSGHLNQVFFASLFA